MRYIEPMYDEYWDEVKEEFIHTDTLIGYRVVSDTGALLGEGETREEALEAAMDVLLPLVKV